MMLYVCYVNVGIKPHIPYYIVYYSLGRVILSSDIFENASFLHFVS